MALQLGVATAEGDSRQLGGEPADGEACEGRGYVMGLRTVDLACDECVEIAQADRLVIDDEKRFARRLALGDEDAGVGHVVHMDEALEVHPQADDWKPSGPQPAD